MSVAFYGLFLRSETIVTCQLHQNEGLFHRVPAMAHYTYARQMQLAAYRASQMQRGQTILVEQ